MDFDKKKAETKTIELVEISKKPGILKKFSTFTPNEKFVEGLTGNTKEVYQKFLNRECSVYTFMDEKQEDFKIGPVEPNLFNLDLFDKGEIVVSFRPL